MSVELGCIAIDPTKISYLANFPLKLLGSPHFTDNTKLKLVLQTTSLLMLIFCTGSGLGDWALTEQEKSILSGLYIEFHVGDPCKNEGETAVHAHI